MKHVFAILAALAIAGPAYAGVGAGTTSSGSGDPGSGTDTSTSTSSDPDSGSWFMFSDGEMSHDPTKQETGNQDPAKGADGNTTGKTTGVNENR